MREHCNTDEREAHRLLDLVRAGRPVASDLVDWALLTLGDWNGDV